MEPNLQNFHWRDTMREVRFFAFDARSAAPILLFIMHMRTWTLVLAILTMIAFSMLERRGLTFSAALRSFRSWMTGDYRPATLFSRKRKMIDFG